MKLTVDEWRRRWRLNSDLLVLVEWQSISECRSLTSKVQHPSPTISNQSYRSRAAQRSHDWRHDSLTRLSTVVHDPVAREFGDGSPDSNRSGSTPGRNTQRRTFTCHTRSAPENAAPTVLSKSMVTSPVSCNRSPLVKFTNTSPARGT